MMVGFGSEFFQGCPIPDHIFHVSLLSPFVFSFSGSSVNGIESNIHGTDAFEFLVETLVPRRKTWIFFVNTVQFHCARIVFFGSFAKKNCFCGFTSILF